MDDMLMSANEVILSTKTSMDFLGLGLSNLLTSVGILGFLAIITSVFFFGLGVGGLSLRGIARIDEYVFQPIIARIEKESWSNFGNTLNSRNLQDVAPLLLLLEEAMALYQQGGSS